MKIPQYDRAIVPERKITEYLLSTSHPAGHGKATFFIAHGFSVSAWQALAEVLRRHAAEHEVAKQEDTPFGTRYTVEGAMAAPDGRTPHIRVVWFIANGETAPCLVTAYPLKGAGR